MRELFNVASIFLSGEGGRELPASPIFFGLVFFGGLMLLLYLTLRIDRD
jgi:hypothetical protein